MENKEIIKDVSRYIRRTYFIGHMTWYIAIMGAAVLYSAHSSGETARQGLANISEKLKLLNKEITDTINMPKLPNQELKSIDSLFEDFKKDTSNLQIPDSSSNYPIPSTKEDLKY